MEGLLDAGGIVGRWMGSNTNDARLKISDNLDRPADGERGIQCVIIE